MIAFNVIHAEVTWNLSDDGTLTISGTDMPDYSSRTAPWYSQKDKIEKVVIENGVKNIGNYAFYGYSSLISITIPNSVTSIGEGAFSGCFWLTSVTIPNSVTSIGEGAFMKCSTLTSITIPNSVTSIGESTFYGCSGLTSITIPNTVTSIGSSAFYGCSNLTSFTIPNAVTIIGSSAFYGCSRLPPVTIPNTVTSIGESAFYGCAALKKIFNNSSLSMSKGSSDHGRIAYYADVVYNNVSTEGDFRIYKDSKGNSYVCDYFGADKSITLPKDVYGIADFAFKGCTGLTSVTAPNSVTSIGNSAFYGCKGLTSITIPNSVTSIGNSAFRDCSGLTSITIPNSVTSIGIYTFYSCSALTSVTIDNSVTNIEDYAFSGCSSLTSITIPNSVTSIGRDAFSNCTGLTSITIPNSVTSIGSYAFKGCSGLTSVTIHDSVTKVGGQAFCNCYNLLTITITNPTPPSCGKSVFLCSTDDVRDEYDVYNYTTLHVPMGSKEAYSSAHEWRYFDKVKEDMEQNGKVYYAKLAVKQGTTGYTEQAVKADETYTIYIGALGENKINAVTFNGEDVTDQVKDGYYTTPAIKAKSTLSISYEESNTTNVKEISNSELKVTGYEGEINISGIENPSNVEVYTTDGKLVENKGSVSGDARIQVKEDELYLVKVGKRTIKIAM